MNFGDAFDAPEPPLAASRSNEIMMSWDGTIHVGTWVTATHFELMILNG